MAKSQQVASFSCAVVEDGLRGCAKSEGSLLDAFTKQFLNFGYGTTKLQCWSGPSCQVRRLIRFCKDYHHRYMTMARSQEGNAQKSKLH